MNRKKLVILDNSIIDWGGHHLEYAIRVSTIANQYDIDAYCLVNNRMIKSVVMRRHNIIKAFSNTYWENNKFALLLIIGNIIGVSKKCNIFGDEIRRIFEMLQLDSQDRIFVPNVGLFELYSIGLLSDYFQHEGINCVMLIRRKLDDRFKNMLLRRVNRKLLQLILNKITRKLKNDTVRFYTDTEVLTEYYNSLSTFNFGTLPIPVNDINIDTVIDGSKEAKTISFIGGAREEKGFHHLANIIEKTNQLNAGKYKIKFIVHSGIGSMKNMPNKIQKCMRKLQYLAKIHNIELIDKNIDSRNYDSLIKSSDIILLPYMKDYYVYRSSGIFIEAMCAGIPTIFPKNTWMDSVCKNNIATTFDNHDDIPNIIIDILRNYKACKDEIDKCNKSYFEYYNNHVFVEKLFSI